MFGFVVKRGFLCCLTLLFTSATFSHTYKGELEVIVVDYFKKNHSKLIYKLHEGKETYSLALSKGIDQGQLSTGQQVSIEGKEVESINKKRIIVDTIHVDKKAPSENLTTQTRNILALIVSFADKPTTTNFTDVESKLYSNAKSMKRNYEISSFNQQTFEPDTNHDGKADIYNIQLNYNAGSACSSNDWSEDAKKAAIAAGININLYRHHMFIFPSTVSCNWDGTGHLGCGTTCKTWIRTSNLLVYAHEIGHNLGMHHAATDLNNDGVQESEYGDHSCIMGNGGYRQINAPHRVQMLWFENFPKQITTTTTSGEYCLYPLDKNPITDSIGLQVIRIPKLDNSATYYISYRKNVEPFGMATPYVDKVNIHRFSGSTGKTFYITALGTDQSFVDSTNDLSIKILNTGGDTARILIDRTAISKNKSDT